MDKEESGLNDKQRRFCEEYVIDLNATQAAIRAGYSKKTANEQGSQLLAKLSIQQFIKTLQRKLSEATGITAKRVIEELAKVGFSDIKLYYETGTEIKDITKLENNLSAAVSSIKITETEGDWGSKTVKEFRLHDKISALDKLGKHLGVFEKDNKQKAINTDGLQLIVNKVVTNDVKGRKDKPVK
jgi:phage terminase small subunit